MKLITQIFADTDGVFFKERKKLVYQINPVFCLMTAGIGFSLLNDPAVKKMDGQMEEWMDG